MNLDTIREWVVSGLVQNFTWMIIAIFFVEFVQRAYENWRYGGWKVVVSKGGVDLMIREISPGKVKEILAETSELSVYIKGVTSPYGWINCDILTKGRELGLFYQDDENRRLVVNLDLNPEDGSKNKSEKKNVVLYPTLNSKTSVETGKGKTKKKSAPESRRS